MTSLPEVKISESSTDGSTSSQEHSIGGTLQNEELPACQLLANTTVLAGRGFRRKKASRKKCKRSCSRTLRGATLIVGGMCVGMLIFKNYKPQNAIEMGSGVVFRVITQAEMTELVKKCLGRVNKLAQHNDTKGYFVDELKNRLKDDKSLHNVHLKKLKDFEFHNVTYLSRGDGTYARVLLVMRKLWLVAWHYKFVGKPTPEPLLCQLPLQIVSVDFTIPNHPSLPAELQKIEIVNKRPSVYCEKQVRRWTRDEEAEPDLAKLFYAYVSHYVRLPFADAVEKTFASCKLEAR